MTMKSNSAVSRALAAHGYRIFASTSILILMVLTACSPAAAPVATETLAPTEPPAPTQTTAPSATATLLPTETPQPTATLTPSVTPLPELALLEDGLNVWCAPEAYAGWQITGPDAPDYARVLTNANGRLQVGIPSSFCVVAYHLNQPAPQGMQFYMYSGESAFLKVPLQTAPDKADVLWTQVTQPYVNNPPYWEVTYKLALVSADGKELSSQDVTFAKPLPTPCQYGGLPDPVTLACAVTDPLEIEPHPDVTFPPYYTRQP